MRGELLAGRIVAYRATRRSIHNHIYARTDPAGDGAAREPYTIALYVIHHVIARARVRRGACAGRRHSLPATRCTGSCRW